MARWGQMTILGWLVLELTDSPWAVALVGFFGNVPMFFLGLVGGYLADSVDRRRVLVTTSFGALVVAVAMLVVLVGGWERPWHCYLAIMTVGVGWALDLPVRRSMFHDLLGRGGVTNAMALDSMGQSGAVILGPAVAGVLIATVGFEGAYTFVTGCYLVSFLLLNRLHLSHMGKRNPDRKSGHMLKDLGVGFRYTFSNQTLFGVVLITVLMNTLLFPYQHILPVIANSVLEIGPAPTGFLQAAAGMGSFVGAISLASRANILHHGRVYVGGSVLALACLIIFSLSRWYALSFPMLLLLGLGTSGFSTMQPTLAMLVSREDMRGKALGVVSLGIGTGPIGALYIGALADAFGPAMAITVNAVTGLALILMIVALLPSLRARTMPDDRPVFIGAGRPKP